MQLPLSIPTLFNAVLYLGLILGILGGVFGGLITNVVGWLVAGPIIGLVVGPIIGAIGGLITEAIGKSRLEIQPTDTIVWNWQALWGPLCSGLIIALVVCGGAIWVYYKQVHIELLIYGLFVILTSQLIFGLLRGLPDVLVSQQMPVNMCLKPNQGIRNSGWNAFRGGLFFMLTGGLLGELFFGLISGFLAGLSAGLINGLLLSVLIGIGCALSLGGGAYLKHYFLRFLLWRSGVMPWYYVRFLEEAHERILLQRVGGGYRFIHPLFQDYFASLGIGAPANVQLPS